MRALVREAGGNLGVYAKPRKLGRVRTGDEVRIERRCFVVQKLRFSICFRNSNDGGHLGMAAAARCPPTCRAPSIRLTK